MFSFFHQLRRFNPKLSEPPIWTSGQPNSENSNNSKRENKDDLEYSRNLLLIEYMKILQEAWRIRDVWTAYAMDKYVTPKLEYVENLLTKEFGIKIKEIKEIKEQESEG